MHVREKNVGITVIFQLFRLRGFLMEKQQRTQHSLPYVEVQDLQRFAFGTPAFGYLY